MRYCVVGYVIGLTRMGNVMYVVAGWPPIIQTFSADTLSPLGEGIHVEGMKDPRDIAACVYNSQLYVADFPYNIWRVSTDGHSYVKWLTTDTLQVGLASTQGGSKSCSSSAVA